MTFTYCIIGGNGGIGLAIVEQCLKTPDVKIITTYNSVKGKLEAVEKANSDKIISFQCNLSDYESIKGFGKSLSEVAQEGIDFFISVSGVGLGFNSSFLDVPYEDYITSFKVNSLGAPFTLKEAMPYLSKKDTKKVAFISTDCSSITNPVPLKVSAYGLSKVALNFSVIMMSRELKDEGYIFALIHPGSVATDKIKEKFIKHAPKEVLATMSFLTPLECAENLEKNIYEKMSIENTGKFWKYDGSEMLL